jgi:hypothetical protein
MPKIENISEQTTINERSILLQTKSVAPQLLLSNRHSHLEAQL